MHSHTHKTRAQLNREGDELERHIVLGAQYGMHGDISQREFFYTIFSCKKRETIDDYENALLL